MSLVVQHNLSMMNTQNRFKINTGNKANATKKLSSGYRINTAADDAAGLSISEKMRWQIRGLDKGERNAQDGVSWVQIGDQALGEVQDMLHRMKELTVQSLNDTNTAADRAALQAEFDALQSEIDKISTSTQFNTKNIFEDHEPTYHEYVGNVVWDQGQNHFVNSGNNDLVITYQIDASSPQKSVTITIPEGIYTTQELTDEIEDVLGFPGVDGLVVEYTDDGTFNVALEGGEKIESITGGLSYLLYEVHEGGSVGSLVGTTVFTGAPLLISNENNNLSFTIEDFNGNIRTKNITLANGRYSKSELIDLLNAELSDTSVVASEFGSGIKLASNDSIITSFKGNMFKIDEGKQVYTSVFYDNVKYGNVNMTPAKFVGGSVVTSATDDTRHHKYNIDSTNNVLSIKANGSTTPVEIVIPEGDYSVSDMVDKLNDLFAQNNLELSASINSAGVYQGITITSNVLGATSKIDIDNSSSAYGTLFVERTYHAFQGAIYDKENTADSNAYLTGGKTFSSSDFPLTITANTNDAFSLVLGNGSTSDTYTIKLDAGDYASINDIVSELDKQLNGANALPSYSNKVSVSVSGGKIKLTATDDFTNITVKEVASNNGFKDLFVGTNVTYTSTSASASGTSSSAPSITLNTPIPEPASTAGNNKFTVYLDGSPIEVTLPSGNNVSHNDIIDAINNQLKQKVETLPNTFTDINAKGTTTNNNFTVTDPGNDNVSSANYSDEGDSRNLQGSTNSYEYNIPAKITVTAAVPNSMTIDSSNNQFQITINNVTKNITLDNGDYTSATAIKDMLQRKIDDAFGNEYGGAAVTLDGSNRLVFTARLYSGSYEEPGITTNINFGTSTSSFVRELHTNRTAATVTTRALANNFTIDSTNDTFYFEYKENGVNHQVTLTLDHGNYTPTSFIQQLSKQLNQQNIPVKVDSTGSALKLYTVDTGSDSYISYSTTNGGTSAGTIFGDLIVETPAKATANQKVQDNIVITNDTNTFSLDVDGTHYDVTIATKVDGYTPDEFVNALNNAFTTAGAGVTATYNSATGQISYETDSVGSTATLKLTYTTGGSAMKAIYGESTVVHPGVTASFNADNKLVLTKTTNGGTLSVSSNSGGLVQTPIKNETNINPTAVNGYISSKHSYIDGANLNEPITIDQYNDSFTFTYYDNGVETSVSTTFAHKDYTYDELQEVLNNSIEAELGAGVINVTVDANGVRLEAATPGSEHYIKNSFGGGFYDEIIRGAYETTRNQAVTNTNGTSPKDTAYIVGRKDVRNKTTEIKTGVNDTLSLDFTYSGTTKKITMTLDGGEYKGAQLRDMIQDKLNDQLVALGLDPNTIEVGIGGINTGVIGSNDSNALNFKLSSTTSLPANGQYIIDGVGGNAAFSVFYQTDGELIEAYVKGSKDINNGVTIVDGENELTFDVDGTSYSITIPANDYTTEELLNTINNELATSTAPVKADIINGNLKIHYISLGNHKISNVGGSAKLTLFFEEHGEIADDEDILIQLSSNQDDHTAIDIPVLNTVKLGINSVVLTKPKYANKALNRIDSALDMVSAIRSNFGAMQNRLEHSIRNNQNTSENVQRSESTLRDANMAKEMVEYSKNNILTQAAQSMMTHINYSSEGVLQLLK